MARKAKAKSNEAKISSALGTLSNNRTPLSSILPVQKTINYATGNKSGNRNHRPWGPSNVLLGGTNPGASPTRPTQMVSPGARGLPSPQYTMENRLQSYRPTSGWDTRNRAYISERTEYRTAQEAYSTNQAATRTYDNVTLPNYNTNKNAWDEVVTKNTNQTSAYKKDLTKFFSKNTKSKPTTSKNSGSRNSSTSKGSRR
tara:strand:- start:1350 stop:1949 length:600 start_codon:yes stop_codon:yes gene_type:complete